MGTPYVGEIRMCPFTFAPQGWLSCDGQLLSIAEYEVLFQLIGTTYGGDGVNNFALPNLQSRIPVHIGSGYNLGQMAGTETVTLLSTQIPQHSHTASAVAAAGTAPAPTGANWGGSSLTAYSPAPTLPVQAMANPTLGPSGGSQPHNNLMPYQAVNFIIAYYGIFPSQA